MSREFFFIRLQFNEHQCKVQSSKINEWYFNHCIHDAAAAVWHANINISMERRIEGHHFTEIDLSERIYFNLAATIT